MHVANLEEIIVKNAMEIYSVLDRGSARRTSAETLLNKQSSRSHSVFTVTIHMRDTTPEGEVRGSLAPSLTAARPCFSGSMGLATPHSV